MTDQEILKLIKKATAFEKSQEVKKSFEDLVGQVIGCYKIGYNDNSGKLFYRDTNNTWQPAKTKITELPPPINLQQVTDVNPITTNNIQIVNGDQIGLYKGTGIKWDYGTAYQTLNPQNVSGQFNNLLLPTYNVVENPTNQPRVLGQSVNNIPFDSTGNVNISSSVSRFGIEDNLGIQNRFVDFSGYKTVLTNTSQFFVTSGKFDVATNPVNTFTSEFSVTDGYIDIQTFSESYKNYSDIYVYQNGAYMFSSRGAGNGSANNGYSYFYVNPEIINTYQVVNGVSSSLMFPFLNTSARAATYLALSVNGNYADAAGNVTIPVAPVTPTIPFYKNNSDAIANGAAQNSTYRLPYLTPGDYYPLALVGPGLQTFDLTMADNCNINTLSANVVMTNRDSGTTYNFVVTRSVFGVSFNPITVTILQGPYDFAISNV